MATYVGVGLSLRGVPLCFGESLTLREVLGDLIQRCAGGQGQSFHTSPYQLDVVLRPAEVAHSSHFGEGYVTQPNPPDRPRRATWSGESQSVLWMHWEHATEGVVRLPALSWLLVANGVLWTGLWKFRLAVGPLWWELHVGRAYGSVCQALNEQMRGLGISSPAWALLYDAGRRSRQSSRQIR